MIDHYTFNTEVDTQKLYDVMKDETKNITEPIFVGNEISAYLPPHLQ